MIPDWVFAVGIIMDAMHFPICFVAFCVLFAIISIKRAFVRREDMDRAKHHAEAMESMRLQNTREIAVHKN